MVTNNMNNHKSFFTFLVLKAQEKKRREKIGDNEDLHTNLNTPAKNLSHRNPLCAGDEGAAAVTTKSDTATLGEGLKDSLDVESNLDGETSDGVDLGTVVDGVGIDCAGDIDGVAPSGVDLSDSSTGVHDESTVAVVGALARPGEVPVELNVSHANNIVEVPLEGTPLIVLEALELTPGDALRDSTGPVSLVVDDRLAVLDDLPNGLADGDDGGNVDVLWRRSSDVASVLDGLGGGNSEPGVLDEEVSVLRGGSSKACQGHDSKDELHSDRYGLNQIIRISQTINDNV